MIILTVNEKLCINKNNFLYNNSMYKLTGNLSKEIITIPSIELISIEIINRILKPAYSVRE
jgi:hypothetical protein